MKRRNILKDVLLSVLFCALVTALTCSSAYAATVTTDKLDYSPGEIVIITGSGWLPGETVTLLLHEEPSIDPDTWFDPSPVADPDGNIYDEFVVQPNDVGVTFTLTATGLSSGLSAQTTFTDTVQIGTSCPNSNDTPDSTCTIDGTTGDCVWGCRKQNGSCYSNQAVYVSVTTACTSDGNGCTDDHCDGAGSCVHTNNTVSCDDGIDCTTGDVCSGGQCNGTPNNSLCDDQNVCTNDVCTVGAGCQYSNNTASCDDGLYCTGTDTCGGGTCSVHSGDPCAGGAECNNYCNEADDNCFNSVATSCTSDGNVCTDDHCDGTGSCVHTNNTAFCDDGIDCTTGDVCSGGQCNGTPDDSLCDDQNVCTTDSCDAVDGCQNEGPKACSALTNSSLCPFDFDTSTEDVSDFRLIFTPDQSASISKLNASNPGQFYYNVFDGAEGIGDKVTLTIDIPYPFVTQGAMPIHVYDGASLDDDNGCLIPGNLIDCTVSTDGGNVSPSGAAVILIDDYNPRSFDINTPVTVACTVPDTGFLYVTLHLDYGLKGKTTGCTKTIIGTSTNASCKTPTSITILDQQSYVFSNSISDSDTIQSLNNFKKNPGIGGLVLEDGSNNPVADVEVRIYDSRSSRLLGTVNTDEDGWYMWQYKYTGKPAMFTVKLPDYNLSQTVTLKSNGFLVVNFTVPQ